MLTESRQVTMPKDSETVLSGTVVQPAAVVHVASGFQLPGARILDDSMRRVISVAVGLRGKVRIRKSPLRPATGATAVLGRSGLEPRPYSSRFVSPSLSGSAPFAAALVSVASGPK